jgi:glutaredoxin
MKHKLDTWGYEYDVVNLNIRPEAKNFMKIAGHKTVPQLYWNKTHLNKVDTVDFTKDNLEEQLDYDNYAGGVELWGR